MQPIALFFLASVAVGGVIWVFIYPLLSGERKAEQRMASVAKPEPAARVTRGHQKSRRDVIENTLKEFDERHKKTKNIKERRDTPCQPDHSRYPNKVSFGL